MHKAIKYAIQLNKEQTEIANKTFGCTRFVYNKVLDMQQERHANGEKRFAAELVGENLQILSTRRKDGTLQHTVNAPTGEAQEDELPF
jgi:hypothetical protein